jgi:spoIIIJ-associated protein
VSEPLRVETTGETVGEAKWHALRELERLAPGIDKSAVQFEVISEGERGLLGVGYAPARVAAVVDEPTGPSPAAPAGTNLAAEVRELLERIAFDLGVSCEVAVIEDEDSITASLSGDDLGLLIGRHGQTIDAIQYLANVISWRAHGESRKDVVVDAAGYRERRRETLEALARRSAEQALATGTAVELEPMTAVERKVVHLYLHDRPGIVTRSEGEEPHRYVVVEPHPDERPSQ